MDVIASSIGATERFLNALLEESTSARELLDTMQDKSLGLRIVGPDTELVVSVHGQSLRVARGPAHEATAVLCATPLSLVELLRQGRDARLEESGASFSGDAETLEDFVRVLELARPDLEEEISRLTGDIIAHETVRVARSGRAWARRALDALTLNTAEYLQEESRDLPSRPEAESFFRGVEKIRDDVERALARAQRVGLEPADDEEAACDESV
jgi:ubiquinone biosynthesis protein UbiJ